jgi:carbon monoxide dehydrogenase subunit G
MVSVSTSTYFNASPQQVWDVISDFDHVEDRISAITRFEVLTDGPVGVGTRFRETRVMLKREATEEMEITAWDPPNGYATECESCGAQYRTTLACIPDGDGTRVEMTMEARPMSFMAKVMGAVMGRMVMGACRKAFDRDLEDLRAVVEGDPAAQPA